jgi:hypothetical protein
VVALVSYDITFQCSILISLDLLDVNFLIIGLVLFLMCSSLVTIRYRLGHQVSHCDLLALYISLRML